MRNQIRPALTRALALILVIGITGCGSIVRSATRPLMTNLSKSVMKQQDLELVRLGAPAYMLFVDGLLESSPDDTFMLITAAELYSAYATAFTLEEQPEQALLMTAKAKKYAVHAASIENPVFAELYDKPADQFGPVPDSFGPGDEKLLLALTNSWAAYIKARPGSWDDVADVPKIEALAQRLLVLDETYKHGSAHLMMGVLQTLLPPSIGGKPEEARAHFERAIEISEGKFLHAYVLFASRYARLLYDRELHDQLLEHVETTKVDAEPELTLFNSLAKREAVKLRDSADEYF